MIKALISWLFPKPYAITFHPDHGYVASYDDGISRQALYDSGHEGTDLERANLRPHLYFVPTKEEAGERINKHAANRNHKIVWKG